MNLNQITQGEVGHQVDGLLEASEDGLPVLKRKQ